MMTQASNIVLVVDDSPETLRLLTDVLDDAGMTVTVALDGIAALKVAARLKPDIVLMDAVMPSMDGFETCRQLKMLSGFDNVPVIFMTGLSEPEHSVRGFEAGGADYVTKPLILDSMMARIRVHLSNARKLQSAFTALDATEQFLIAVDREGEILWFTPRAYRLIEQRFGGEAGPELRLPDDVLMWLRTRLGARQTTPSSDDIVFGPDTARTRIGLIGAAEHGEILLRISDVSSPDRIASIKSRFSLTQRESEVLLWLSQGKSNRDIAAILSLSPRTVDKHLEVIFSKLSVENRTAAAALVLNARDDWS